MHEDVRTNTRTYMSVMEMGELLGLGKTESYWLINKKYFPSATRYGKTWVELAGFEDWYANQVKYRKKNGEEPGIMLRERSYSAKELAQLLSISESAAYGLIKKNLFRTTACNGWMRVPKDSFWQWYEGQDRYRTREDREKDVELESSSLSFADMGKCLGISRNEAYRIVKSKKYGSVFESIMLAGKPRITKESFEKFLKGQDKYRLRANISAKENHTDPTLQKAAMAVADLPTASTSGHDLSEAAPPGSCHPESGMTGNARFKSAVPGDGDPRASMPGYALPDAAPPGSGFHEAALPENIRFESAAPKSSCPKGELQGTALSGSALPVPSRNALHEDSESRYITLAEAARMAGISRQAVSGYANQGCFLMMKKGRNVRLGRPEFCQWLEARRSMQAPSCRPEHGLNGKTAGR